MIKVICNKCNKELTKPGALVFGVPKPDSNVWKGHICVNCFKDFKNWLKTKR